MKKMLVAILAAAMTISLAGAVYAEDPAPVTTPGQEMKKEESGVKKTTKKKHVKKKKTKKAKKMKKEEGKSEMKKEEGTMEMK